VCAKPSRFSDKECLLAIVTDQVKKKQIDEDKFAQQKSTQKNESDGKKINQIQPAKELMFKDSCHALVPFGPEAKRHPHTHIPLLLKPGGLV
jgi:hypothetical protein